MFVKLSFRDRLISFADLVGMTLLSLFVLLPLPNCFLRVCLPTLFAAFLLFFLPLTTSAHSGTANSNKSAPTRFAAGLIYLRKEGNCGSPNDLCKCAKSPSTLSSNISIEWNHFLSWSHHLLTSFRLKMNVGGFSKHQSKRRDTSRYNVNFFTARVSQVNVNTIQRVFEQRSEL